MEILCSKDELLHNAYFGSIRKLISVCFPDLIINNANNNDDDDDENVDNCIQSDEDFLKEACGMHDENSCIWIIKTEQNNLVGIVTCVPYTSSLYVFNLAVSPDQRKKGHGAELLMATRELALKLGKNFLSGSVVRENTFLLDFYSKLGAYEEKGLGYGSTEAPSARLICPVSNDVIPEFLNHRKKKQRRRRKQTLFVATAMIAALAAAYCIYKKK